MSSLQSRIFNKSAHIFSKYYSVSLDADINKYRQGFEIFSAVTKRVPRHTAIQLLKINSIESIWLSYNYPSDKIILYFHGGAYVMGSIHTHKSLMAKLAYESGANVLGINYRLAPEHPFPSALEDAVIAYEWLLARGNNPKNIFLAGDSAGGGLAIATMLVMKEKKLPLPAAAVCLSPWLDLSLSGPSFYANAINDPLLRCELGHEIVKHYLQDVDPKHPLASPLFADLSHLPPIHIQVSRSEVLYSDALRFQEKAFEYNVNVTLDIWENMLHGWQLFHTYIPEARKSVARLGQYINNIDN